MTKQPSQRNVTDDDMTIKVTVSMTVGERKQIKHYATDHGVTVSGLIKSWIAAYCTDEADKA